jgi:hypothetical protein
VSEPTAAERPEIVLGRTGALELLRHGTLEVTGRLVHASNATLVGTLTRDGVEASCVYKPVAGERPLWDFPDGTLAAREVATHAVSEATGWGVVPPTVMRDDGPFGPGMCQLWIDADEDVDLLALVRSDSPLLRRMAVLDAVVNNADRKGGHLIPTRDGHVYGVDHGVCFAVPDKLRTVLWQWRGKPLPPDVVDTLDALEAGLAGPLGVTLGALLAPEEVEATRRRVRRLRTTGVHPSPSDEWPALPWPPF